MVANADSFMMSHASATKLPLISLPEAGRTVTIADPPILSSSTETGTACALKYFANEALESTAKV